MDKKKPTSKIFSRSKFDEAKISLEATMELGDHLAFGRKNFLLSTNVFNNKLAYV